MRHVQIRKDVYRGDPCMFAIILLAQFIPCPYGLGFQVLYVSDHRIYEFQEGMDKFAAFSVRAFIPCMIVIVQHHVSPSFPDALKPWRLRMEMRPSMNTS